jgi:hypothetical protein
MNVLEQLYTDVAQFREYSPYTESNISFSDLSSSALSAVKQVVSMLSKPIYDSLLKNDDEKKDALRCAVANLTLAKQLVFNVLSLRKADVDVYKSEQEQMKRAYRDNYFNSMDTLLQLLDSDEEWKKTDTYQRMNQLQLKTVAEFDRVYPIDNSYLYFFRCIPIQQEALDDYAGSYYDRLKKDDATTRRKLDRTLAKLVVAISLRRFDILEFPATIRNLFEETTAGRSGKDEQQRMITLADELFAQALESLSSIDLILSGEQTTDIVTQTSFNEPTDKIYLMG